jgi:hypothetical protein
MSSSILTLENALIECRKYDNDKAQVNFTNFMRQNSRKPVNKTDYSKANNQKIKYVYQPTRPAFANNFVNPLPETHNIPKPQNNSFPRGPIDIKPKSVPPPKILTNSQVFGKQKEDKPVPMSVCTRNTVRPTANNFRNNNNFKNNNNLRQMNRQPDFTFEEIYNTQTDYDENEFFSQ